MTEKLDQTFMPHISVIQYSHVQVGMHSAIFKQTGSISYYFDNSKTSQYTPIVHLPNHAFPVASRHFISQGNSMTRALFHQTCYQ